MRRTLALPFAAALALAVPALAASDKETFGKPLAGMTATPLAEILKSPDAFSGKALRTEGTVSAVCAQKGCWMTLGDGAVRVTFKDYAFFVPKDIAGSTVVVEGTFKVETIPEATAKHYASETKGGKPDAIKGDQKQLTFEATGVELTRKKK